MEEKYVFDNFYHKKQSKIEFEKSQICLLDMRGKETLAYKDRETFSVFIFGGILGDHPPRDRTKELRD